MIFISTYIFIKLTLHSVVVGCPPHSSNTPMIILRITRLHIYIYIVVSFYSVYVRVDLKYSHGLLMLIL